MVRFIFITLFSILVQVGVCQNNINFHELTPGGLKNLSELSEESGKPMFVYITTDGCPPCERIRREVFVEPELIDFLNQNFVCVRSTYSKSNLDDLLLRDRFDIQGNPNMIIINADLGLIHRLPRSAQGSGFRTKDEIMNFANEALENKFSYAAYKEKYDAGDRSYETVSSYLALLTPVAMKVVDGEYENYTQQVLDSYFETQVEKDYASENNWFLIKTYVDNPSSKPFQYLMKNPEAFYSKYGEEPVRNRIKQVLTWYGDYGDYRRLENARKEMGSWGIPMVNDFLASLE